MPPEPGSEIRIKKLQDFVKSNKSLSKSSQKSKKQDSRRKSAFLEIKEQKPITNVLKLESDDGYGGSARVPPISPHHEELQPEVVQSPASPRTGRFNKGSSHHDLHILAPTEGK